MALIFTLLFDRSPSDIAGFVVAIWVRIAIHGERGRRALADVGKKVFKAIQPALANLNSSPTIILVFFILRISASLNHRRPHAVLWRASHTVRRIGRDPLFPSIASARCCMTGLQVPQKYLSHSTAITFTEKTTLVIWRPACA